MAKNKVSIDFVIGAYDRFSAAFARFNAKLESATGAVSRMQAQVSRFSQRSGLSKVAGAAGDVADAFSGMQDGAVKTKLAIELMGDEGRKLIPVLNKGASGLRELGKEAEQAGMVFDDTARSDARRFQESLSGVGNQVAGLRNAIGRQLMPVFTPIMEKFEGWLRLNKGLVAVETGEWVQKIADNIPAFLDGAERWLSTGGKVLGWCTDFIDRTIGMENALKLVALYMGTPFIRSLFNAGKAVAGFGLALSTNPIGAFITAIGLLVAAGWWLYNNWEEISAGMKKFCTEIKNAVQGVADVQDAADLHGIDLEDTDALMDPENARILAEAAKGGSREAQAEPSMPESTTSGFSDLARSGTVSSETVRKEEKEVTHKVELIVPAGMEARVDRQASDAVTVKRDNMGYGWAFAGV